MLRKVAQDIPVDYPNLKELIQNMFETNTASDGVGLAAPQIGKSIRVVIIDLDVLKEDFPEYEGFRHAFINAHIVEYDEESKKETMEEGCLSIPGLHERVTRPTRIHVRYSTRSSRSTTSGWRAIWPASCSTSSTTWRARCLSTACLRSARA